MASPVLNVRIAPDLLAALDARAERDKRTRSEVALAILAEALLGFTEETPPPRTKAAPRKRATAAPSKAVAQVAPAAKPEAARQALASAEARVGVRTQLDTSSVPFAGGMKRAPYQRARDRKPGG